jgi:hypothetical protein
MKNSVENYKNFERYFIRNCYYLTDEKPGIAQLLLHVLNLGVLVVLRLLEQRRLVDQVLDFRLHLGDVESRNSELFLDLAVRRRWRRVRLLQLVGIL